MGHHRIPFLILLIGVLVMTPMSVVWAKATQKPANWLGWETRLEALGPDRATLTLTLTTALPEAATSIHLNLPAAVTSPEGADWQGTLTEHQTTHLQWTLTGPIDITSPVGIRVVLTLPEGDTLDHPINAEWSTAGTPVGRTWAPEPTLQSRQGEPLLVTPLTPEAQR